MAQKKHKWIFRIGGLLFLLLLVYGGFLAYILFMPNTRKLQKNTFFYVHTGAVYQQVLNNLRDQNLIRHPQTFDRVAHMLDYPGNVKAGKYKLKSDMSNLALVRLLRSGRQTPVRLIINKERTKPDMARFLSSRLEPDSAAFMMIFNDSSFLQELGFTRATALCAIIPNTYQFFWNTDARATYKRLASERDKFWTKKRRSEADSLHLTLNQVYILASIVEEESNFPKDKKLIASVYLNRLHRGIMLGADPTVKFALNNFQLKRITGKELQFNSPYNTYLYAGLPPGPICTPSIKTIDAVLNAPKTSYLYFCAKPDFSGYHNFATTYSEHLKNARAYHKALNERNIH